MQLNRTTSDDRYLELLRSCLIGLVYEEGRWPRADALTLEGKVIPLAPEIAVQLKKPIPVEAREEGRDWPFLGYTMIGGKRLDNVRWCVEQILENDVPGDLLEAGVWRGGAAMYMRALMNIYGVNDRTIWLADSFQGMPPPTDLDVRHQAQSDLSRADYLRASQETVEENFRRLGLLDERVRFLKGWFRDTLATAPVERLALLRMDGDLYSSTIDTLQALYHKVSPGGFVIADDYHSWAGCRQAVTEFREQRNITAPIQQIDWTAVFWQVPAE